MALLNCIECGHAVSDKARYTYPAIFTPEKDGGYSVKFPDLESCYTCGDDIADSLIMAEDVLALVLCEYEESGKKNTISFKRKQFCFIQW